MILALLKAGLRFATKMAEIAQQRQLLAAGEAQAVAALLKEAHERIVKAQSARTAAESAPLDADDDGVFDSDGFRRD